MCMNHLLIGVDSIDDYKITPVGMDLGWWFALNVVKAYLGDCG